MNVVEPNAPPYPPDEPMACPQCGWHGLYKDCVNEKDDISRCPACRHGVAREKWLQDPNTNKAVP